MKFKKIYTEVINLNDLVLISVVMPVYNASNYLKQTMDSLFGQSYDHWELIAIDDCSKDDSYESF
jgi:teichuronic acid biosynthesis glycosyltransferase TuaG